MALKKLKGRPLSENPRLSVSRNEARDAIEERRERGKLLFARTVATTSDLEQTESDFRRWDTFNTSLLNKLFKGPAIASEYNDMIDHVISFEDSSHARDLAYLNKSLNRKLERLQSVLDRLGLFEEPVVESDLQAAESKPRNSRKVFIVHGRDNNYKETVARFLKQLDLEPIILHEQANQGRTLLEKFEAHSDAAFAVVMLTGDDEGRLVDKENDVELQARARQNVVLELGFFWGSLGRKNVCVLYEEGVEIPSDLHGLVYIPLADAEAYKVRLAREIKASGIEIDFNRAL